MNRLFNQFRYSLEKKPVDLYLKAAIGASGAPTIDASLSKGIASIARNSAGDYTITLQDKYVDLYMASACVLLASGTPASVMMALEAHSVASAKTIDIQFLDFAGAAVELDNGAVLRMKFELKASKV